MNDLESFLKKSKEHQMIKTVLLDMDGVLVDFVSAALRVHGLTPEHILTDWPKGEWDVAKIIRVTDDEFWAPIDRDDTFWPSLRRYPECNALLRLASSAENWAIATSPSRNPMSSHGKVKWLQNALGDDFRKYYLCAGAISRNNL